MNKLICQVIGESEPAQPAKPVQGWSRREGANVVGRNIDWSKSNTALAAEYGESVHYFYVLRKARAPETQTVRRSPEVWDNVDWSKSNKDIAAEIGVSRAYATIRRHRQAPETVRAIDWDSADWNKPTSEITKELGLKHRATVSRKRAAVAADSVRRKGISLSPFNYAWDLPDETIAMVLNIPVERVPEVRERYTGGLGNLEGAGVPKPEEDENNYTNDGEYEGGDELGDGDLVY